LKGTKIAAAKPSPGEWAIREKKNVHDPYIGKNVPMWSGLGEQISWEKVKKGKGQGK